MKILRTARPGSSDIGSHKRRVYLALNFIAIDVQHL